MFQQDKVEHIEADEQGFHGVLAVPKVPHRATSYFVTTPPA
jgi:hypothetical protein